MNYSGLPDGKVQSFTEMYHLMCQYPDVITDLNFVCIDSLPLELRKGDSVPTDSTVEDGAYTTSVSDQIRSLKILILGENTLLMKN